MLVPTVFYTRGIEHFFRCRNTVRSVIFIVGIYNLADSALNYRLGALVAGEERNIKSASVKTCAAVIEYCVKFRMAYKHIFCVKRIALSLPWEDIVAAIAGHSIVSNRQNFVIVTDDTGAHLC